MGSPDLPLALPARYRPLRHLADGGMASVWVAHDTLLDREVAVKVLSPALAADDDARTRFTREARAAGRLSGHPHVVTVYDAGEHDGQAFLVMALYTGGTVADRLRDGVPPVDTALRWLREAADGLDAAHAADVVHRDVKPANLLLDERDRVAVGDFGIATAAWAASVTQTGLVVGTAAYLAPEQRIGGLATAASDRYALGVVAHQLLTGIRPPDGRLDVSLAPAVREALSRATATDPADRPSSARALVADLERAVGSEDLEATTVATTRTRPSDAPVPLAVPAVGAGIDPEPPTPARPVRRVPRVPAAVPAAAASAGARTDGKAGARSAPARPSEPRRGGAARLLVPLAVLAAVAGAGIALLGSGDDASSDSTASTTRTATATTEKTRTSEPEPTATPAPEPTATATPTPAGGDDPKALNDEGFALYGKGRYAEALPLLERAVAGLEATPDDQYYAFALFNLGATLRRLGRPADAIPYLERRLEVSDFKRGTVEQELAAAREEAGVAPAGEAAPATGPGNGKGQGKAKKDNKDEDDD